jgi:lysophospholipase L1-like esterase
MKHILIFGGSIVHGVGGVHGGWANMLKTELHTTMYGPKPAGETCEIYELGVPGNTLRDVIARLETELHARMPHNAVDDTYIIFSAGTNDSKAEGQPGNYLFTEEDFATTTQAFLHMAKQHVRHVLGIGLLPVDAAKTNPKHNPLTGRTSYFRNARIKAFENVLATCCKAEQVAFVPLFQSVPKDWAQRCLSGDGLHPNDAGYEWVYRHIQPAVHQFIGVRA